MVFKEFEIKLAANGRITEIKEQLHKFGFEQTKDVIQYDYYYDVAGQKKLYTNDERLRIRLEYTDKIFVSIKGKSKFIAIDSIVCLIAHGNYSQLFNIKSNEFLVLKTLREWEQILPVNHFIRIHRSTIINKNYIKKIEPFSNYTYRVEVQFINKPLEISRKYAKQLKQNSILI